MDATAKPTDRFRVVCIRCDRPMSARPEWVGRDVRCPHCDCVVKVPPRRDDGLPVRSSAPSLGHKRYFNFACARCGCLLEGHTGMIGQAAHCPTCAARFVVPGVNSAGQPDRAALLDERDAQDPTPMHAYAASGDDAPTFERLKTGEMVIVCPRCRAHCALDAQACSACQAPFTMDAAPTTQKIGGAADAIGAVLAGGLSLFLFPLVLPSVLAIWLGCRGLLRGGGSVASASGGIGLGILTLCGAILFWATR